MAKTAPINMRAEPEQYALLTRAARLLNMDRTSFVLEAACREAENVLLDQRLFMVNEADYVAFETALDKPVPAVSKLKALMNESAPWE